MEIVLRSPMTGALLEKVQVFLAAQGLDWDPHIQATVVLMENGEILAAGSRHQNVPKSIAVSKAREGEGLTATVVTELTKNALQNGHAHLFLFTKPSNEDIFRSLGFHSVASTRDVSMLENRRDGVARFVEGLECPTKDGVIGSIVANCNPFTNGHRFLVETAASQCGLVHLFILSEDRSAFDAATRMALAKAGTADLGNVVVHPTSDYLISSATFPDYFIKDKAQAQKINCELDLTLFAQRFAIPLHISRRYVGSEPTDQVTAGYNRQMHQVLPRFGLEVVEVPRREIGGAAVSASTVRRLLAEDRLEDIRPLVPAATYDYLARQCQ